MFDSEKLASIVRHSSLPHTPMNVTYNMEEWNMLVAIPFETIGHKIKPSSLKANVYKCGDNTYRPHYMSWNPIETLTPNFHCPEYFGTFILE